MHFNLISKSKRVPMMSRIAAQEVRMQASPMETESLDAWEITGAIKEDVYRIDMSCMFDCGFIVLYEMIMLHLYNRSIAVAMFFHFVYLHVVSFKRLEGPSGAEFFVNTVSFHWTLSDESIVMGFH